MRMRMGSVKNAPRYGRLLGVRRLDAALARSRFIDIKSGVKPPHSKETPSAPGVVGKHQQAQRRKLISSIYCAFGESLWHWRSMWPAENISRCSLGYYDFVSSDCCVPMENFDPAEGALAARLTHVRVRITAAAQSCDRSTDEVTLIAISKTHPASAIKELIALGATDIGENRVQEAEEKIAEVGRDKACWHLVGHLQANKARRAVNLFDVIHSLDSLDLARRLDRLCVEEERQSLPVLIQVDLGHEETKTGIDEKALPELIESLGPLARLRLIGLMTLPPYFENPEHSRPFFRRLRELRDELADLGSFGDRKGELSMGMTHDFAVAIAEGATMVRIGTAIFGERPAKLTPEI
jgi:PLP dependent protein